MRSYFDLLDFVFYIIMEVWKDIKGYKGIYQISNHGNVKSFCRLQKGIILKKQIDKDGYETIFLISIKRKNQKVHRLVAEAFIPNIENKQQVNHIDGIRNNNNYKNLEWVTCKENIIHSHKTGRASNIGENHPSHKLKKADVITIRKSNLSKKELSEIYKVKYNTIWAIINYKNWKHV